ncbi:MAG: MFS transporter [Pseudobdellovibrionaceae bacterium]
MSKPSPWKSLFEKRMLIIFLMGFASGAPFLLTGGVLKIWLAREQVDISVIGYFSWVGLAYSLKFLWAPLLDRFTLFGTGRRKSWLVIIQAMLILTITWLGSLEPMVDLKVMAAVAVLVAFFSATQDIAIDAYRREICKDEQLGVASALTQYGYRISMILSTGVLVSLVGSSVIDLSWHQLYYVMAACMGIGLVTTLLAPEPEIDPAHIPKTLASAFVDPFREFLTRKGALLILLFVFLFKLGDALSAAMLSPYYVHIGYSNADIGLIAKTFGLASVMVGLAIGGVIILYLGIYRSLWTFGILQALSTASFALLTFTGAQNWALAFVVVFEDLSAGMGNAAFIAYLGAISNRRFTATQFAVFSSVAGLGRNFFAGFTGDMVKGLGWPSFFITCALIAVPGLLMLLKVRPDAQTK